MSGGTCEIKSAAEIRAALDLLMDYVVPNDNSATGKWDAVVAAFTAGDFATAQSKLNNLIGFINLKYGQLSPAEQQATITELNPTQTVAQYKDLVIGWMNCFISFDLNPGDPPKVFTNPEKTAGVWFPENYVPVGTNVEITTLPNGDPLVTPLDKYGTFVSIKLVPQPANLNTANGLPVVVVCFQGLSDQNLAERLLLGAQHLPNEASGFELLEEVSVPQSLATELTCGANLDVQQTAFQRVLRKAADFLLPQKLHARFFALGGVGGSPEEFSDFGAIDPQLRVAGAGGSPEEFSKAAKAAVKPSSTNTKTAPPVASIVIQTASATGQVGTESTTGLPSVTVQTEGLETPIPGVKVTFSLQATLDPDDTDGNAHFCGDGPPQTVDVFTNAQGEATLPCINWGTTAGYMNLKATVDGTSLGHGDLIIITNGAASPSNEVNFLIQATAGSAAALTMHTQPSGTAQAGAVFGTQPKIQVRDANGNPVDTDGISVTATVGTGSGDLAGDLTVETVDGVATFTDLRIDGVVGNRTLSFTSAGLTGVASGTVSITAGNAAKLAMVTQPSGARAGIAFTTQPSVEVQDAFGNDVDADGVTITAAVGTGAGNLMGTNTANTTDGVAGFSNLRIDGAVGARTLDFSAPGLTGVSSASFNVTAGNATALAINTQPSATATAGVAFGQQPVIGLRDAWNNVVTSPEVSVTASITSGGLGALFGTLSTSTVGGVATFTNLRIDGLVGSRTLDFASGALTGVTSGDISVGAGSATTILTYMPAVSPTAASLYNYGSGLPTGPVSFAPRVLVTDAFTNPVSGVGVTWSPVNGSNGATLTVGSGGTTDGSGLAQASSWSISDGLNQVIAEITGSAFSPATFTATGPTGQTLFSCALGASKADLGWMTVKTPVGNIRTITIWMSVTGQSSTVATYPATIEVRANGFASAVVGGGTGGVTLPGNNGNPTSVTFNLSDPVTQTESGGASGNNTLWIDLKFPGLVATRKMQVWYQNSRNLSPSCADARIYPPGSTQTNKSKQGLSILLTN